MRDGRGSGSGCAVGCVLVLREGPKEAQPFGVWFTFVIVDPNTIIFVDVQNRFCAANIHDAIANLEWNQAARSYCFYALYKQDKFAHILRD